MAVDPCRCRPALGDPLGDETAVVVVVVVDFPEAVDVVVELEV